MSEQNREVSVDIELPEHIRTFDSESIYIEDLIEALQETLERFTVELRKEAILMLRADSEYRWSNRDRELDASAES